MSLDPPDLERDSVLAGLRAHPPRLSPRYFYDAEGSRLFDAITRTEEYYPTRTELAILRTRGDAIARHLARGSVVIELGSGSGDKVIELLGKLDHAVAYRPIDISPEALAATREAVARAFPALAILPFEGDFTDPRAYRGLPPDAPRVVYYSGSTIGNFDPPDAVRFLRSLRALLSKGDTLVLAADLVKDAAVLHAAYNDAQGVTAAFNKNALAHLNRRFGLDFDPEAFDHRAEWNARRKRIEMHLVPRQAQTVHFGEHTLEFVPSQPIHTESSYKFDFEMLRSLAEESGFAVRTIVTDDRRWFAEAVLGVQ